MAKRYSQPQSGPVQLDPKWLAKGLVQVFAGDRLIYDKNSRLQTATLAGGPKLVTTPGGIVTGFGTTYGTGTSDRIDGPVLPAPASGLRSIVAHFNAKTTGGGALGRIFQATTGAGNDAGEGMYFSTGVMSYNRATSGSVGQWGTTASIALGVRTSVGFSHDQSSTANVPVFYIDGKPAASSAIATPTGTYGAGVATSFGNRSSDSARYWDGWLGIILFFDGFLSATDQSDLHANPWQVFTETQRRIWGAAAGGAATFSYTPTGGVLLSGIASIVRSGNRAPSGGVLLSGASPKLAGKVELAPTGGLTFSGSASQLLGRTITPTGGLSFAGAANSARGVIRVAAGGLLIAGTSAMSTVNSLVVMPVGGMLIAGTAATVRTCTRLVSGGISLAGHAVTEFGNIYTAVADWVGFIRRGGRR